MGIDCVFFLITVNYFSFQEVKSLNLYITMIKDYTRKFLYKSVLYLMVESCVVLNIYVVRD